MDAALASYDGVLALKPDHVQALYNRGIALADLRRPEAALASYDQALALKPDYPEALNNRGTALRELGRAEDALASYEQAIALKPDYAVAHDNRGLVLTELGRFDEAGMALAKAIDLAPKRVRSYYNLALLDRRWTLDDPRLLAMEALARDMTALGNTEQIELHFALSKAYAKTASEQSFRHLIAGNALKRRQAIYDEAAALAALDRIRASYPPALMRERAGRGAASAVPVFILGMPRSGTTLGRADPGQPSRHFGAGEIEDFARAAGSLDGPAQRLIEAPEAIAQVPDSDLHRLGSAISQPDRSPGAIGCAHHQQAAREFSAGRADPSGAAGSADHPHAARSGRYLPVLLHPALAGNLPYTYDLAELGRYHRAYDALMTHWRDVLPSGVMLEVQYESVVADLEAKRAASSPIAGWTGIRAASTSTARTAGPHRQHEPGPPAALCRLDRAMARIRSFPDAAAGGVER